MRGGLTFRLNNLQPTTTVAEVKTLIFARLATRPIDAQRLIFVGKEIDDARDLGSIGVMDGATLHLAERSVRTKIAAALHALKEGCVADGTAHRLALKTLSAIIRNVQKKPDEEKYRKLRARNAAFKRKFGGLPGSDRVLFAVGFKATMRDEQRHWILPDTVTASDLDSVAAVLAAELASYAPVAAPVAAAAAAPRWAPPPQRGFTPAPPAAPFGGARLHPRLHPTVRQACSIHMAYLHLKQTFFLHGSTSDSAILPHCLGESTAGHRHLISIAFRPRFPKTREMQQ